MWTEAIQLLLYGGLTREQFHKVRDLTAAENSLSLKLAAIVQILYFGVSFIMSLGVSVMANKQLVYAAGTLLPLILLTIYMLYPRKNDILPWLVDLFSAGIFMTGLLCTLICTPDEMTILLLIFFFCVPILFVNRPLELVLMICATDIIYVTAAPILKSSEVLFMDTLDIEIFSTLSVILGVNQLRERFRRYWLETSAVDLAELRYQAAFIDQLTGLYNRNAYNKATEELEKAPLSSDFMFIALDINGLKTANDTFGHVAGDELICGAASCMRKSFDEYGKVYRVGGDEFIILLNTGDTPEGEILDRFNAIVDAWHGTLVKRLSVSYGVVMRRETDNMLLHEIELLADKRMYQAKADYYKNSGIVRRIV